MLMAWAGGAVQARLCDGGLPDTFRADATAGAAAA